MHYEHFYLNLTFSLILNSNTPVKAKGRPKRFGRPIYSKLVLMGTALETLGAYESKFWTTNINCEESTEALEDILRDSDLHVLETRQAFLPKI